MVVLYPTYFSPVAQFVKIAGDPEILFEKEDHFQKQTYRNRCYIYGANGKQLLTVPVLHSRKTPHQKTKDVLIDNSFNWQRQHIRSLQAAYRSSPYFEFYEDEVIPLMEKKFKYLFDLNIKTFELIAGWLELETTIAFTGEYREHYENDFRFLVDAKKQHITGFEPYTQVFSEKHGFLPNLSMLDLIFNLGPESMYYIEAQCLIAV